MDEEGEGGKLGGGGYTAVHIVYPHKDLFKHLTKAVSVYLWMDQKVCAIIITILIVEDSCWKISPLCKTSMFKFLILYLCSWTDDAKVQEKNLRLWMRLFEAHMPWLIFRRSVHDLFALL